MLFEIFSKKLSNNSRDNLHIIIAMVMWGGEMRDKNSEASVNTTKQKNEFSSRIGFVLSAAGSAVGLGNLWRFPYLAAQYGGGIFLLIYILLATTFGYALMLTEIAMGRKTGKSVIGAFSSLNRHYGFIGYIAAVVPMLIFPYYCVIGGWVVKYLAAFLTMQSNVSDDGYFPSFISTTLQPIVFLCVFLFITAAVVLLGVQKGIEKFSKVLMPVLLVLTIIIAVYSLTLDGAMEGLIYYVKPNFSHFSAKTVVAALGQLFYSMSLAMGIMITYGSYMKKDSNLEKSVRQIEIFDTGIAFLAGLMIIPAVFAFSGGDSDALSTGPSLMFVTLPKVFQAMPGGAVIGTVFFLLVFFAALTSSVSLMETIVSIFSDKIKADRTVICILVMIGSLILAVPSSLGFGAWDGVRLFGLSILDAVDFFSNNILMPIVALLTSIFIGYVVGTKAIEKEVEVSEKFRTKKLYNAMIKYFVPVCLTVILISSFTGV